MQTGDVTPRVLGGTPAGQVVFQDLAKSANRWTDGRAQAAPDARPTQPASCVTDTPVFGANAGLNSPS